jgi:hypothetical protein
LSLEVCSKMVNMLLWRITITSSDSPSTKISQ